MAQQSFPFENIDTTETQFSQMFRNLNAGVDGTPAGTELKVTAGTGLQVALAAGQAMVRGHYYINTASLNLTIEAADLSNPRIDSIVLTLDVDANSVVAAVVKGTPASSPVAPTLTQTDAGVYQMLLANVAVPAASVVLGTITDKREFMGERIGLWTTDTRPANPVSGKTLGYNTSLSYHEFWNGSAWVQLSPPVDLSTVIPKSLLTTTGDLIVASGASTPARLGIGTSGQVLKSNGTTAAWGDVASGGIVGPMGTMHYDSGTFSTGTYTTPALTGTFHYNITSGGYAQVGNTVYCANTYIPTNISVYSNTTYPNNRTYGKITVNNQAITFKGAGKAIYNGTSQVYPVFTNSSAIWASNGGTVLYRSTDGGTTWTTVYTFASGGNIQMTYANSLYVAYSSTGLATSTDGITWTARSNPTPGANAFSGYIKVIYGNGLWALAYWNTTNAYLYISTTADFSSYTLRLSTTNTGWQSQANFLSHNGLTSTSSKWLLQLRGGSAQYTSTDGITWTAGTSYGDIYASVSGNNIFANGYGYWNNSTIVGTSKRWITSTDGITWTNRTFVWPTGLVINAYGISGSDGWVMSSGTALIIYPMGYTNGKWYLRAQMPWVAEGSYTTAEAIFSTSDFTTYTFEAAGSPADVNQYGNQLNIGYGVNQDIFTFDGTNFIGILSKPVILSASTMTGPGRFELHQPNIAATLSVKN